jgi:SpoVK/Ycf46/Vps4 family AAA+-type ATPase
MNDQHLMFDEPSASRPRPEKELTGPLHLTTSQARALGRLCDLAGLRGQSGRAGIILRNKPLIIGPSGSGKTAIVRRLCDVEDLPLLVVNTGSWIVHGAYSATPTLSIIRRFVDRHPHGCILLDEIDKACPAGAEAFSSTWALSTVTEILSLLDADGKLTPCGWTSGLLDRLSQAYLLVGAGAWQSHAAAARAENGSDAASGYAGKVTSDAGVPEELLFRFNPRLIEISPPSGKDLSQAIRRIHVELSLPELSGTDETRLVKEAMSANCGMRWIEQYLADLLIQFPRAREKRAPVEEIKVDKIHLTRTEFAAKLDKAIGLMETTQKTVWDLQAKTRVAQQIALHAPAREKKNHPEPKDLEDLIGKLEKLAPALQYGTCTSRAERDRVEEELHVHGTDLLESLK